MSLRAAQYMRMSTDHQKYSTENQVVAIAAYAAERKLTIVRTYEDIDWLDLTNEAWRR
jgi:DNA invertase Pin-like site-specific DNA recombinase